MTQESALPADTYRPSEAGGLEEAQRLRKQAALMLSMELPVLLDTLGPGAVFLDLGCGMGVHADAVAQARPDATVLGMDGDPLAMEQCRRVFGGGGRIRFEGRRLEQGPWEGMPAADVALLRLVLMHLPQPERSLREAHAFLRPGGVLHVLEADDGALEFEPALPYLAELTDLMQTVQADRGGSRRLGQGLPAALASVGWEVLGRTRHLPDPKLAAASFAKVFLPVAAYYLAEAEQRGLAAPDRVDALRASLQETAAAGLASATLPLYHVWARSPSPRKA